MMAKCTECVHYGVCKVLVGEQQIRIADKACSFAEKCVAYKHKENFAEVVRCKDCKYWEKCYSSLIGEVMCCTGQGSMRIQKLAEDFCSSGERRNDDA